ncbi:MAG TPA: YARHG domain-containing protein [Bacteroidales bacterium]|nr:YARHG domain-containing protein [Bacteroidales bacterium]
MKICKKCNIQYDDSKNFCKKCGAPLEAVIKIESKAEAKKQVFEEKLKTEPHNVKLLREYGQFLYENKLFNEAISVALKIIAIDEKDNSARELLFNAYVNIEEFAKAAETGEELYSWKSKDASFLLLLANAHQQAGASPRAVEIYDQMLALQPDNTEAAYQKALALLSQNMVQEAILIFGKLFAAGKTDRITSIYAGIEKALNRHYQTAIEILTPVLSVKEQELKNIDTNRGYVYLSHSLCKTTDDIHAIEKWSNLIDLNVLNERRNTTDEITAAETIVMILKHQLNRLQSKGERYEIQQQINEYLKNPHSYFTEASLPVFASGWHAAAIKQESFGFYDDAVSSMKKCVELAPENTEYAGKLKEFSQTLEKINRKKKKRKLVTITTVFAVIIIAVAAYFLNNRYQDNKAWKAAMIENTSISFQKYRVNSPKGRYYELSKVIEDSLFWEESKEKNTLSGYATYLSRFKKGKFRKDAILNLERAYWIDAKVKNSIEAISKFIERYPNSDSIEKAKLLLNQLSWNEYQKTLKTSMHRNYDQKFPKGKFPQASIRLLNESDLNGLSKKDLKIMRNEIFARYGYIFITEDMKFYFSNQPWYQGKYKDVSSMLTDIEIKNVKFIKKHE